MLSSRGVTIPDSHSDDEIKSEGLHYATQDKPPSGILTAEPSWWVAQCGKLSLIQVITFPRISTHPVFRRIVIVLQKSNGV